MLRVPEPRISPVKPSTGHSCVRDVYDWGEQITRMGKNFPERKQGRNPLNSGSPLWSVCCSWESSVFIGNGYVSQGAHIDPFIHASIRGEPFSQSLKRGTKRENS